MKHTFSAVWSALSLVQRSGLPAEEQHECPVSRQASRCAGGWLISFSRKVIKNYFHGGYLPRSLVMESIQRRNGTELSFHFCFAVHL